MSPSPCGKHFPTPAIFSRPLLICNSLGFFFPLASRTFCHAHRIRIAAFVFRAHKNPKASQQGVATVISFSPTAVIGFYAPALHYLQGRGAGGQRLFTRRLITTNWATSLHCRQRFFFFFPPYRQVVNAKKKIKKKRYINSGTVSLLTILHSFFFFQQKVVLLLLIEYFLLFSTRLNISDALELSQHVVPTRTLVSEWSLTGRLLGVFTKKIYRQP